MQRGESQMPRWARRLPAVLISQFARHRRQKGFYDTCTLSLYRRAWSLSRSPSALVDYAMFRRDLGFPLAANLVEPIRQSIAHLRARRRRQGLALLSEVGIASGARSVWADDMLSGILDQQERWRAGFTDYVRSRRAHGICVVGNAAWLNGAGCGALIDQHGAVVRFNRFRGAGGTDSDLGTRLDIWVVAPDFIDIPPGTADWLVVTGPDMRYRRSDWSYLSRPVAEGAAIITIPLGPWRHLVGKLQAPPSAGLLFLAWLHDLLGSWSGIRAVGFGGPVGDGAAYHHADARHRAGSRHNWKGERSVLEEWMGQGLHVETII